MVDIIEDMDIEIEQKDNKIEFSENKIELPECKVIEEINRLGLNKIASKKSDRIMDILNISPINHR